MEAVGGSTRIRVDARVLAATNKDLTEEIRAGRFREDLYFRLNVVPIFVPPLRERPEDIQLLADHFMALLAREYGRRPKTFEAEAVAVLRRYGWPGNVRELRNVVERLMIMVPGEVVTAADLAFLGQGAVAAVRARRAARPHRAAAPRARRVREGLHPARARGAARQHVAHRRRPRRRAQQPVSQDAPLRHRAVARGRTTTWSRRDARRRCRRHPDPGAHRGRGGARPQHRAHGGVLRRRARAGCGRTSRRTRRRRSPAASSPPGRASASRAPPCSRPRRWPASATTSSSPTRSSAADKCARAAALARGAPRDGGRGLGRGARGAGLRPRVPRGVTLGVLVDLNVGQMRCGVAPGEPALALASRAVGTPGLALRGVMGYEGHVQPVRDRDERAALARTRDGGARGHRGAAARGGPAVRHRVGRRHRHLRHQRPRAGRHRDPGGLVRR